jgi:serine/threonine-protein kinase
MSEQNISPTPGDLVADKYRIERELGRGAYGVVFLATQEGIDRKVAVKTLLPKAFFEEGIVERFEREAKFVGKLNHPNIVRVHDYGRHGELLYMAVEYVEGLSLEEIIEQDAPLEPERTRQFVYQMLDALAHAHDRGIVHRDLKPGNILVVEETEPDGSTREVVKILDFGIAKLIQGESEDDNLQTLTQAGTVLGTPHYMSPESIVGEDVDHTVDLYALGVIIYEMLTGRRPFTAKNSPSVMVRHLRDDPPPLPQHLEDSCWGEVVRGCMEKQPQFRLDSPDAIRELLERRDEAEAPDWWKNAAPTEQLAHLETMERQRAGTTQQSDDSEASRGSTRAIAAIVGGILVGATVAIAFWLGRDSQQPQEHVETPPAQTEQAQIEEPDQALAEVDEQPSMSAGPDEQAENNDQEPSVLSFDVGVDEEPSPTGATEDESDDGAPDGEKNQASADDQQSDRENSPGASASAGDENQKAAKEPKKTETKPAKTVTLEVRSTPTGARVKIDGRPVGTTPTSVELDRSKDDVEVVFSHIGYQAKSLRVSLDRDRSIDVRLEKGRLELIP